MDKAPDAFRTISEVAEDLDLPQHVLRFWETRFTQIKPMKRSGGRRYYRPDDVDLLKGIRHLLYGEGYTIRGVQRILKEQGVRSVQAIAAGGAVPAEPPPGADTHETGLEAANQAGALAQADDDVEIDEVPPVAALSGAKIPPVSFAIPDVAPSRGSSGGRLGAAERSKLQAAMRDLLVCRQMLDEAVRRPDTH